MSDLRFDHIPYLHLLWVVPVLAGIVAFGFAMKDRALRQFASANLLGTLVPGISRKRQIVRAGLVLAATALMIIALVGPRWGTHWEDVQQKGLDMMICLDVSKSMLAGDVKPNRLERAKQDIRDLLSVLPGDRVGLIAFAGKSVLKCPLTIDYGFYRLVLDDIGTGSAPLGGTNLGDAIRMAAESFDDRIKNYKTIVVISDGEDQESYPIEAAQKAYREKGIRIFSIGLGDSSEGSRIPAAGGDYVMHDGKQVWSKMNPECLQQIALAGGGAYVPAGTQNIELDRIYTEKIAPLEKREFEARKVQRYYPRYQLFAAAALALLLAESAMSELSRRRNGVEAGAAA